MFLLLLDEPTESGVDVSGGYLKTQLVEIEFIKDDTHKIDRADCLED